MIRFGTDGWRAIIAKDFTFDNLARVAYGVARYLKQKHPERKNMYVGFDRRFLSEEFAQMVASIYAFEGFDVFLTKTYCPTPVLSFKANQDPKAIGATIITASHNPPIYNGFKFKEFYGCSALQATTDGFEKAIEEVVDFSVPCEKVFQGYLKNNKIKRVDLMDTYRTALFKHIDTQKIKKAGFRVAVDCMYGSGSMFFREILESLDIETLEIHAEENPGFCGVAPEPVEKNLKILSNIVKEHHLSCGFATDGDGDRLGAVDEHGNAFTTQMILSCVYWHWLKNKKKPWNIARSVSTTKMVDLIAEKYGQICIETPVGFKYIADQMVQGKAQIGGEESGGVGIEGYIPERDGIFTALMLLELMAFEEKSLHEIYAQICEEIRPYQFVRLDLHVENEIMVASMKRLQDNPPNQWLDREIDWIQTIDGFKFYMKDGSWLLIRPSGTEPVFRIYAEAENLQACHMLTQTAKHWIEAT